MKIKVIEAYSGETLEERVNEFLESVSAFHSIKYIEYDDALHAIIQYS